MPGPAQRVREERSATEKENYKNKGRNNRVYICVYIDGGG